ncbi:hypothetical protein PFISCL1PPCAC_10698 [Pristionchus fissidentatus]|uniref:Transmembrane protein 120A n=1 Tax=Pristionchus fissidentatus TaxID=1538716 RepID=A0AAV5VLB4_9BILA|nr:hypothetical protein PFISCL1PPCAC_10698 [Pristionchus fissidentatus]
MESLRKECGNVVDEFTKLESSFSVYIEKRNELTKTTESIQKAVKTEKGLLTGLAPEFKSTESVDLSLEEKEECAALRSKISDLRARLEHIQQELPVTSSGFYLSLILGSNLNVSLGSAVEKNKYKQEYEGFKYKVTMAILVMVFLSYLFPWRVMDSISNFLMVWYYCTLTIRESILRVNGSKIKGWWVIHHYLSCVFCGVVLTWRDGECYREFRPQFLFFIFYIGCVQMMQHQYQTGCLRRLHSLGQGHEMDITMEGFSAWMFSGLTFLLPFLFFGYVFQLANAYVLYQLQPRCEGQWQVWALSLLFFIIAIGNISTTGLVIARKFRRSTADVARRLRVQTKSE